MGARTVLLIEDDAGIGEVLKMAVELEGFEVFWAHDGRQGLQLVDKVEPAVILCDMMMPVLDGFGFLREHTTRSPRPAPVIAMSAMVGYVTAARESGAVRTLQKPLDLDDLISNIQSVLAEATKNHAVAPEQASVKLDASSTVENLEQRRIAQILTLQLEQPAPEKALQEFVDYVRGVFDVPVCLISIITATKQYWTAMCGIEGDLKEPRGGRREDSFCSHAVVAQAPLVVQNAAENPLFKDNPFVTKRGFRFYAGVPLILRTGEAVGTLCMLDFRPREFSRLDLELLSVLAKRVLAELDRRAKRLKPEEPDASFPLLGYVDQETGLVGREGFMDVLRIESCRETIARRESVLIAVECADGGAGALAPVLGRIQKLLPQAWVGRLGISRLGMLASGPGVRDAVDFLKRELKSQTRVAVINVKGYCGVEAVALSIVEDEIDRSDAGPGFAAA